MAFNAVIETLAPTVHRDTLLAPLVNTATPALIRDLDHYPYALSEPASTLLLHHGVPVSGLGLTPHPHPAHKTLELFTYRQTLPSLLTRPTTVCFMKPSKFLRLSQQRLPFVHLLNQELSPRDVTRYAESSALVIPTALAYFDYALMFYGLADLAAIFTDSPELETVVATLIVPPESLEFSSSFHPELYQFEVHGSNLLYFLENHSNGSYIQPLAAHNWLTCGGFHTPSFTCSVALHSTVASHHVLVITKRPFAFTEELRPFDAPDSVLLPHPDDLHASSSARLVPRTVYDAAFSYVRSVRTLRESDPDSFIRTQRSKPEYRWVTPAAWDALIAFAKATSSLRPDHRHTLTHSRWEQLRDYLRRRRPELAALLLRTGFATTLGVASALITTIIATPLVALVFLAPALFGVLALCHFLFRELNPQESYEQYQALLHPTPFRLVLTARMTSVTPSDRSDLLAFPQRPLPLDFTHQPPWHEFDASAPPELTLAGALLDPPSLAAPPPPPESPSTATPSPATPLVTEDPPSVSADISAAAPANAPPPAPAAPTRTLARGPPPPIPPRLAAGSPVVALTNPFHPLNLPSPALKPTNPFALAEPLRPALRHTLSPLASEPACVNSTPSALDPDLLHLVPPQPMPSSAAGPDFVVPPIKDDPPVSIRPHGLPLQPYYALHQLPQCPELSFLTTVRPTPRSWLPQPTKDCLLHAIADQRPDLSAPVLWERLCHLLPDSHLNDPEVRRIGLTTEHLSALAFAFRFRAAVHSRGQIHHYGPTGAPAIALHHTDRPAHFASGPPPLPRATPTSERAARHSPYHCLLNYTTKDGHALPFRQFHTYRASSSRAHNLASNLKAGFDGSMARAHPDNPAAAVKAASYLDRLSDLPSGRKVSLFHLTGAPGCGKTAPLAAALRSLNLVRRSRVVVPTINLRSEWKEKHLQLDPSQSWRVSTFETSLLKTAEILIIDEVYRLPRGYLDLAILADPSLRLVILLGDPAQASYHSLDPRSTNSDLMPETEHLAPYRDLYCLFSYRIPEGLARLLDIGSFSRRRDFLVNHVVDPDNRLTTLAPSIQTAQALCSLDRPAITYTASQGLDFSDRITLFLDNNTRLASPNAQLVALTRSKRGVFTTGDLSVLNRMPGSLLANSLTGSPTSYLKLFHHELRGATIIRAPTTRAAIRAMPPRLLGGAPKEDVTSLFDVFHTAPILSGTEENPLHLDTHFLPGTRRPLHRDLAACAHTDPSASATDTDHRTVHSHCIPGEHFEDLARSFMPAHDPVDKEQRFRGLLSQQFPSLDRPNQLAPQPLSLLAPIHSPKNDPTLLVASINKRLRFRPSPAPYQLTARDEILGYALFQSWSQFSSLPMAPQAFDPVLYAECINLNEYAQLTSKTKATIAANAHRSDPDWRHSFVRIFAKAQHKVNANSLFTGWKACQTLALMHDYVILMLGPVKKYQRVFHSRHRHDHVYVHAGNSPAALSTFCAQHLRSSQATTNDYTAFDQSQHGEAVVFERLKMHQLGIPAELVNLHIWLKTHITTQFGPLTCMRLTGEPGTYDDNTDYNLAILGLCFKLTARHTIFVSGDDSAIIPRPHTNPAWDILGPLFALRFKIEHTDTPLFCGYYLGPAGACRDPLALFAKLAIALDADTHEISLPSYLAEFSTGHALGDAVFQLFPTSHVRFYSACFDFFCRYANKRQKQALSLPLHDDSFLALLLTRARHFTRAAAGMLRARGFLEAARQLPSDLFPTGVSHSSESNCAITATD
jgi:hypothetical protein